jgi:hypothetical protein
MTIRARSTTTTAILIIGLLTGCSGPGATQASPTASSTVAATPSPTPSPAPPDAVFTWNAVAIRTAITNAKMANAQSLMYIAPMHAAVYDAVIAIRGGYQPYARALAPRPGASVDAAIATAAHDVLAKYFPTQLQDLDADLGTSLAAIPEGTAKTNGVAVGKEAAVAVLEKRQGDGLEADIKFSVPAPAPGMWQPPQGQAPQTPWVSKVKPFTLDRPDQFRAPAPPDLKSAEWAKDYNEIKTLGGTVSAVRTADQADIAKFWTTNAIIQVNTAFKALAQSKKLDAVQAARLFAMGNVVGADALIACLDSKYNYLLWRPQYAVPQGESDGNPDTAGDPSWTPLVATPNHPEYPSAHACLTGAEAEMFASFLGTRQIEVDITSATLGVIQTTRHFKTADDLIAEITGARIWGGLHYRFSMREGLAIAKKVSSVALEGNFKAR